jgi:conjugative relaxase-like TrwC/TraI family protein
MLNIGRMGPGSQRYYLEHVAAGVEDYYLGRGEAPGRWLGHGLDLVGLDGQIDAESLGRVLAGQDPASGVVLASHPSRKVPGFDCTFRAPKSVSLLWALADEQTSAQVEAAHDHAVASALAYMEAQVARTRRGTGGTETVAVDGLIAAAFRHRTSRAGDPLLHTHLLVANLVHTRDDGIWRTLDSRALFAHAKTAGTVYQAALRHHLTKHLGVAWKPVVNGCADLSGVQRLWIDAFSKRRAAIVHVLAARGETSAKAAQVATLATRQPKRMQPDEPTLRARWHTEATDLDIPHDWWRPLLDQRSPVPVDHHSLYRQLVDSEALTEATSTFARRDVIRAIADALPDGAPVHELTHATDRLLRHGLDDQDLVPLGTRRGELVALNPRPGQVEGRLTTRGLLLLEQHTVTVATTRTHDHAGQARPTAVAAAIGRRPSLSDEQATMIHRLTTSGAGVEVVVGKAGTGKTYALDAARDAWTASGIRVTGVALAARAALELQESAGIESTTLARLLHQLDDPEGRGSPLQPGQVLVVDEAGMIGTRPLARLLHHAAERDVKVVLVGDPRQLPEIDAGGLYVALANRLDSIELADNRRQTHAWEQDVLDQLRHGDVTTAVDTYQARGRLVSADTAEAIREQLVADWWHTHHTDPAGRSVMVALRRADVDDLNTRARLRLQSAGMLTGPALDIDGVEFQAGDRIVCLRNERRLGVVNGTRATITHIAHDRTIAIVDDHGTARVLPAAYLEAGHVAHGYAITGHKAQGLTVDHTYVLGSDALYREWGYVALSRGRQSNQLYVHRIDDPIDGGPHTRQPDHDPITTTVRRLTASRAEAPLADRATLAAAARWREAVRFLDSQPVAELPKVQRDLVAATEEYTRLVDRWERLAEEQSRRSGPALRRSTRDERKALEADLEEIQHRALQLSAKVAELTDRLHELPTPAQIQAAHAARDSAIPLLHDATSARVATVTKDPPSHLTSALGPVPRRDHERRSRWRSAATAIEGYRLRWNITDPHQALGPPPSTADWTRRRDHTDAQRTIDQLTRSPERHRDRGLFRGIAR